MKIMRWVLNGKYACIQGAYWMFYVPLITFASAYLLERGYSNSEIGIVIAIANVLAVFLQPVLGDLADRSKKISLVTMTEIFTALTMVLLSGFFLLQNKSLALTAIYVLVVAWYTTLQPFCNAIPGRFERYGIHINYGVARGFGSLTYSLAVATLGTLVERFGTEILPVTGEIVLAMLLFSLIMINQNLKRAKKDGRERIDTHIQAEKRLQEKKESGLLEFIKENRMFFFLNLTVIFVFFHNITINNYMLQIISNVGGNSADMGRILGIMAFLELPAMFFCSTLRKWFSCQLMLKVSMIAFVGRIGFCYLADSVTMVMFSQFFQAASYALFIPVMIMFINESIKEHDAVKGQALFTTMMTVSTVIASIAGGVILDLSGPKMLLLISTIITILGGLMFVALVDKIEQNAVEELA